MIHVSRFIFLFMLFSTIIANYVTQVISCQTKYYLDHNMFGKHIVGVIMAFSILMMDGGWSFNREEESLADTSWNNANVIDTMIYSIFIYILFLASAKMRLLPNISFYTLLFISYCINTQRIYWQTRDLIDDEMNTRMKQIVNFCIILSIIILVYGILDYYFYQKREYKKEFTILDFIIGKFKCDGRKKY